MTDQRRQIDIRLSIESSEELDELERGLLKARAGELGEVRRRQVRLSAGYGDATTREVMDDEGRRAEIRHRMLTRLLEALRSASG